MPLLLTYFQNDAAGKRHGTRIICDVLEYSLESEADSNELQLEEFDCGQRDTANYHIVSEMCGSTSTFTSLSTPKPLLPRKSINAWVR